MQDFGPNIGRGTRPEPSLWFRNGPTVPLETFLCPCSQEAPCKGETFPAARGPGTLLALNLHAHVGDELPRKECRNVGIRELSEGSQRAQYPLNKEDTLNYRGLNKYYDLKYIL